MELQEKLNFLFGGEVCDFKLDILNHSVSFEIRIFENEENTTFNILIERVSSFLFDDPNSLEFNNYDWDKIELSSFYYSPLDIYKMEMKSKNNDFIDCKTEYNLFLEFWESKLFIRSENLIINNEKFVLK
ncbi:MAG: hypothetical protein WC384_05205 [Prolixibacteraceae bacterium]|jgi:hypothetical protein